LTRRGAIWIRPTTIGDQSYRWRGHRVYVIDGSTTRCPTPPALRQHYGVSSAVSRGPGIPSSHLMLLMDHRSVAFDRLHRFADEHATMRRWHQQTHRHLQPGDICWGMTRLADTHI